MDVLRLPIFLAIACNGMELLEVPSERSAEASVIMKEVEGLKMLASIADRDLKTWWTEFNNTMQNYTDTKDSKVCTDPSSLNMTLTTMKTKIDHYLDYGIRQKTLQLNEIKAIIQKPKFRNSTGLHDVLMEYIEGHLNQTEREKTLLSSENTTVLAQLNWVKTKVCHCSWRDWGAWSSCSHNCSGGYQNRTRANYPQRNGGNFCDGNSIEIQQCNPGPCPVDCAWGQWESWGACSTDCTDGMKRRNRQKTTEAQNNGNECTGNSYERVSCNTREELQTILNQTQTLIDANEGQCTNFIAGPRNILMIGGAAYHRQVVGEGSYTRYWNLTLVLDLATKKMCRLQDWPSRQMNSAATGLVVKSGGQSTPLVCGGEKHQQECSTWNSNGWESLPLSGEDYNATLCHRVDRRGPCFGRYVNKPYLGFMWTNFGSVVVKNEWLFMAGGQDTRQWTASVQEYQDYQNETILVNGDGVLVRGPDLSSGKKHPCVAVVEDHGDIKVIAVIGGKRKVPNPDHRIWREEHLKTMERFRCNFGQSKPSCIRIADGPEMNYPKNSGGCAVVKTADDKKVLISLRDNEGHSETEILDLSNADYQWEILSFGEQEEPFQQGGRDFYNFIVASEDEKTAYWTRWNNGRDRDFIYKLTCETTSQCNFEKVWFTQQGFELNSNVPDNGHLAIPVPATGSFVCP